MKAKILITGATGTTGQYAIQALLKEEIPVRAMVRKLDERSEELAKQGVEIVQGDFLDYPSLDKSLQGIESVYFCYPFQDYLPKAAAYLAKAARKNGVKQIVNMSQMNATEDSPSPATQNHLLSHDILDWADVGAVHLRPALFAWNYLGMAAQTVATEGKFYFPASKSRYSIVHPQDIGEVVAAILKDSDKDKYAGQQLIITGNTTYSNEDVAQTISELIGNKVEYVPIPLEHWLQAMNQVPAVTEFLSIHFPGLIHDINQGKFSQVSDTVKNITGKAPRTFEQYLQEHQAYFTLNAA